MKWDFKIVVLLVEWSSFRGGLKAGFYCSLFWIYFRFFKVLLIKVYSSTISYRLWNQHKNWTYNYYFLNVFVDGQGFIPKGIYER